MKRFARILASVLALTVGLWACQDQVVTPDVDVEASFAKKVKPPPDDDGASDVAFFTLTTGETVTEEIPFNLEVTAWKKGGRKVATAFSGPVSLETSVGDITPATVDLVNGVSSALVTLSDPGTQTVTADGADGKTGELTLDVAPADPGPPFYVNGRIAFCSDRGGGLDLWMLEEDQDPVQLTFNHDEGQCMLDLSSWAWSPGGSQLAYKSNRSGNNDLYVVDVATGADVQITNDPENENGPTWSPDGGRIAFKSRADSWEGEIYVMEWDGTGPGEVTPLTTDQINDGSPNWSPVHDKIAWVSDPGVSVLDLDTEVRLDLTDQSDANPLWSPGGTKIAFWREAGFRLWDLFMMNADGSGLEQLTDGPFYYPGSAYPVPVPHRWHPLGSMIAITDLLGDAYGDNSEILLVPASGGSPIPFTESPANDRWGDWSPGDGAWIVFESDRYGAWDLLVKNVVSGEVRVLTDGAGNDHGPVWVAYSPPTG